MSPRTGLKTITLACAVLNN